ncbi:MAG: TAT-variant-translocated molybdopterin oxidoreductase [Planctomycetota bacterium]
MNHWRSLDEHAQNDEYRKWADREFPDFGSARANRRDFIKGLGAALAAAGLISCRRPDTRIVPYGESPPEVVPGLPLYYATTYVRGGQAMGVLAETHVGRPIKLEGNPLHPANAGKLDAFAQAAILDLYDPDRSRRLLLDGKAADWEKAFLPTIEALRESDGTGVAILSGRTCSPAVEMLRADIRKAMPKVRIVEWEPLDPNPLPYEAQYDLEKADRILALDADPLGLEDEATRHMRGWSQGRGGDAGSSMNRLYVAEPHLTTTGMAADHRLRMRASEIGRMAGPWFEAALADLRSAGKRGVVIAGRRQPPGVHAAARAINESLQSEAVRYTARVTEAEPLASLATSPVTTLIVVDANPALTAMGSPALSQAMEQAQTIIHLGAYRDETARRATWHVPMAHWLESWGDALARNTLSPIQPMIDPIFGGKSELEFLALLAGRTESPRELVETSYRKLVPNGDWNRYLHRGVAVTTPAEREAPAAKDGMAPLAEGEYEICFAASSSVWDGRYANNAWLLESPDPVTKLVWDNAAIIGPADAKALKVENGDVLKISTAEGAVQLPAMILPGAAPKSIQVALGFGREYAGQLGRHAGRDAYPARGAGGDIQMAVKVEKTPRYHPLATTQQHWTIETHEVVEGAVEDRALIRSTDKGTFDESPDLFQHMGIPEPKKGAHNIFSPDPSYTVPENESPHQWGMAIDLTRCIGCNACAVACQSENNVPIVGKDEVIRGREMSWIRIDRFFEGDPEGDVSVVSQPMLCQHCENAPCEVVCPVNATVHDDDGLNLMVYNRCIGTRYCANNCPYKVRRFNYTDYNKNTLRESEDPFDGDPAPNPADGLFQPQAFQNPLAEMLALSKNPDVTVRMRGVMEKCTFCVQRIQAAKIQQKVDAGQTEPELVPDGDIRTACEQTCATDAIVFGNIADPTSRVSKARAHQRAYKVLDHLNVRPRVSYLGRIYNPNPALATEEGEGA